MSTTLREIAHSRAGDKGDTSNLSLIPYDPDDAELLRRVVTEERVLAHFAPLGTTAVRRYELPNMPAFNFVLEHTLDGGNTRSLRVDGFGKSLSAYLLSMEIPDEPTGSEPRH